MANFVRHESCPNCGSKDNLAIYDDGKILDDKSDLVNLVYVM